VSAIDSGYFGIKKQGESPLPSPSVPENIFANVNVANTEIFVWGFVKGRQRAGRLAYSQDNYAHLEIFAYISRFSSKMYASQDSRTHSCTKGANYMNCTKIQHESYHYWPSSSNWKRV